MRITTLKLSESERIQLEKGYHLGETHCFRIRCKSILLKSQGETADNIAKILEVTTPTVFSWLKRYKTDGMEGLKTQPGRGRKPIIGITDEDIIRKAIEEDRQSVSKARETWQNATGKKAGDATLKRFLSVLVQDISE